MGIEVAGVGLGARLTGSSAIQVAGAGQPGNPKRVALLWQGDPFFTHLQDADSNPKSGTSVAWSPPHLPRPYAMSSQLPAEARPKAETV